MLRKLTIERDKEFYRLFIALWLPLFLQAVLQSSVFFLDSIMLGNLGEIPMSASSMAKQPFNIISGIVRGLTLGGGVLIAQY